MLLIEGRGMCLLSKCLFKGNEKSHVLLNTAEPVSQDHPLVPLIVAVNDECS